MTGARCNNGKEVIQCLTQRWRVPPLRRTRPWSRPPGSADAAGISQSSNPRNHLTCGFGAAAPGQRRFFFDPTRLSPVTLAIRRCCRRGRTSDRRGGRCSGCDGRYARLREARSRPCLRASADCEGQSVRSELDLVRGQVELERRRLEAVEPDQREPPSLPMARDQDPGFLGNDVLIRWRASGTEATSSSTVASTTASALEPRLATKT